MLHGTVLAPNLAADLHHEWLQLLSTHESLGRTAAVLGDILNSPGLPAPYCHALTHLVDLHEYARTPRGCGSASEVPNSPSDPSDPSDDSDPPSAAHGSVNTMNTQAMPLPSRNLPASYTTRGSATRCSRCASPLGISSSRCSLYQCYTLTIVQDAPMARMHKSGYQELFALQKMPFTAWARHGTWWIRTRALSTPVQSTSTRHALHYRQKSFRR